MKGKFIAILLLMILCTGIVSAGWITPPSSELTSIGFYSPYVLSNINDGNLGTQWVYSNQAAWVNWSNPSHKYIDKFRIYPSGAVWVNPTGLDITGNITGGQVCAAAGSWYETPLFTKAGSVYAPANSSIAVNWGYYFSCGATGWANAYEIQFYENTTIVNVPPVADFTGTPTSGPAGTTVVFSDNSTNTPTGWSWDFGDGTIATTRNATHTYNWLGQYSVSLTVNNSFGSNTLTKSNYIHISPVPLMTVNVDIKDSVSGALIQDSSVGIRNTTSGVWRNGTAPTGLIFYDTTNPGYLYPLSLNQSITIAASKTGYKDTSLTFSIPYDNYRAFLYLVPSSVVNASGTGTVVATVVRNIDGLPLSGTSVTLSTGQMGVTNSAGAVTLRNVTAGTPTATAINSGYQTTASSFTLSAGETKMIVIQMVRDGETPVTTYGSPTPTRTPGPGDPGYAGVNTSSGALNERGSTGLMEMMGQLIELWPLVLIILFMKFMKDAFS